MAEVMKGNSEYSETSLCQNEPLLRFFGVICVAGKQYAQVVSRAFRITMATLYPDGLPDGGLVQLVVRLERTGDEFLLCVLKHGEIHQVNLNLIFSKEEEVLFQIKGMGRVCLTGYQIFDSEDALHDENIVSCPLAEITSASRKKFKNLLKSESETTSQSKKSKAERKALLKNKNLDNLQWTSFMTESNDNSDTDDESDESFVVPLHESESESESSEHTEEDGSDVVESDDDIEEDEVKDLMQNSQGPQKRKREMTQQPQKRSKSDNFNTSTGNLNDVIDIDEDDDDSDSPDVKKSSIGSTPVSKQQITPETSSSKKKKEKKKKRLSEISSISQKSENIENEEQNKKSPAAQNTNKQKDAKKITVLEGGVEIQDVVIGRGPVATKGKMLYVFYVGRLQDKTIFDSRVPGKKPFSFKLGANQVIKGWDIGLQGMKVGGQRKLKIPPTMGYGKKDVGLPPNSYLYFTVELQAVS